MSVCWLGGLSLSRASRGLDSGSRYRGRLSRRGIWDFGRSEKAIQSSRFVQGGACGEIAKPDDICGDSFQATGSGLISRDTSRDTSRDFAGPIFACLHSIGIDSRTDGDDWNPEGPAQPRICNGSSTIKSWASVRMYRYMHPEETDGISDGGSVPATKVL